MEEERTVWRVWVDWGNKVISFHEAEGFACLEFPTHREMFSFAIEKGFGDFAIQ